MNRREFLQCLAALGAAIAIPIDLATASAVEINAAWTAINHEPIIFTVAPHGTISIGDYEEPSTRAEMYGIEAEWSNRQELVSLIQENWQIEDIAQSAMEEALEDLNLDAESGQEVSFASLEDWLAVASDEDVAYLEGKIRDWLEAKPDVGAEYEWLPPMNHVTPESSAYSFFKGQPDELLDVLGVVFVEGDSPDSSYFGAELHYDIAFVNEEAEFRNIPIRFRSEDDSAAIEGGHHG
jgi:hypothetical protein